MWGDLSHQRTFKRQEGTHEDKGSHSHSQGPEAQGGRGLPGNSRELRGMLGGSFLMGKLSPKEPNPISLKHLVAHNGFANSYCGQNVMTKAPS